MSTRVSLVVTFGVLSGLVILLVGQLRTAHSRAQRDHGRIAHLEATVRSLCGELGHGESSVTAYRGPDGKLHVSVPATTGCAPFPP